MKKVVLVGSGGNCKTVIDILRNDGTIDIIGILDPNKQLGSKCLGIPIIGDDRCAVELFKQGVLHCFITPLNDLALRKHLIESYASIGFHFITLIHPSSIVSPDAILEEGVLIGPGAIINANAHLDMHCAINSGAIVEHDANVGAFSHIAPNSTLLGGSKIGSSVFVGANSTLLPMLSIGDDCVIGAGSVVIDHIKPDCTAYGAPARARPTT